MGYIPLGRTIKKVRKTSLVLYRPMYEVTEYFLSPSVTVCADIAKQKGACITFCGKPAACRAASNFAANLTPSTCLLSKVGRLRGRPIQRREGSRAAAEVPAGDRRHRDRPRRRVSLKYIPSFIRTKIASFGCFSPGFCTLQYEHFMRV